jgi:hypothetical protein
VKLQFIGNDNPFRDSSAGVQFFSSSTLSNNSFVIKDILGFVADLVVEDDAESRNYFNFSYKGDNSRLKSLYNLSAYVRREVGKKVLEAGGNAVLGYSSHFDFEDASCVVVRAYGTVCRLLKVGNSMQQLISGNDIRERRLSKDNDFNMQYDPNDASEIISPLTKEGNSFIDRSYLLTHSLILTCSLLLTHLLTYSLTHSYLLTHSLTHSLTYLLTHSLLLALLVCLCCPSVQAGI